MSCRVGKLEFESSLYRDNRDKDEDGTTTTMGGREEAGEGRNHHNARKGQWMGTWEPSAPPPPTQQHLQLPP